MRQADAGPETLTAQQVREIAGVPVSTLHDWAAKRERGIDAPGPHHLRLSSRHRRWALKDSPGLASIHSRLSQDTGNEGASRPQPSGLPCRCAMKHFGAQCC